MSTRGIRLRSLSFTGAVVKPAILTFEDGLNIVYGASNTGKSFVAKAINFMLGGGDDLPDIEQREGYDGALLAMVLPDGGEVTLHRSVKGGDLERFDGLLTERPKDRAPPATLSAIHSAKSGNNVSQFLLSSLGLSGKEVVTNIYGEKDSLSFRKLAAYVVVGEGPIMDEASPVLSPIKTENTAEKNVFRLLMTGTDDSAVVAQVRPAVRQAKVEGQIELLDELIQRIDAEIGEKAPLRQEMERRSGRLEAALTDRHADLRVRQERIDALTRRRRWLTDEVDAATAKLAELETMSGRFAELDRVFLSDIERLVALEEGGFLLKAVAGRPCALCGADPEHQVHSHAADEIARTQAAAAAEIAKIQRERRDLSQTMASVNADAAGLSRSRQRMLAELADAERNLETERPEELRVRTDYEQVIRERDEIKRALDLYTQRDRMAARRSQLSSRDASRSTPSKLQAGVSATTAHEFSQIVQELLRDWGFPGNPVVAFDPAKQDIQVDGKGRASNGKGVRAVLHSAFKVAILIHCRRKGLPHPGFIVLDTPLLTYREPMTHREGALSEDEQEIKDTKLSARFFRSLAQLGNLGQFIVLENIDPPPDAKAHVTVFVGQGGEGRQGFFPRGGFG